MAPTKKTVLEALAKAQKPETVSTGSASTDVPIMLGAPPQKRRRQLGRRMSEEQTERALQLHFSHLPKQVVETKRINGLLLREKILSDYRAAKASDQTKRLGASYWRDLADT